MEVFLTLNGIGRGHLMRALAACSWLRRNGRRPVVFFQGTYTGETALRQAGVSIPPLYELPRSASLKIGEEIARYALLSEPSMVIEDTHPAPVIFPASVKRVLMVRPVEFATMCVIEKRGGSYQRFVVCDDPGSPTWPFTAEQTAQVLRWPKWRIVGPVFRRPRAGRIAAMRARYRIEDGEQVFVFSMGGGGERPGSGDRERFLEAARSFGAEIRASFPRPRLLFVCGPLFPPDLHPPPGFEEIREEPDFPSLLALALGAVVRPGFNTTWEAIVTETPILSLPGTTHLEPVTERLQHLAACGLVPPVSIQSWLDRDWLEGYRSACRSFSARYSGAPAAEFLSAISVNERLAPLPRGSMLPVAGAASPNAPRFDDLTAMLKDFSGEKRLLIRMDDVVDVESAVEWLYRLCRDRGLCASLEVIPYLMRFDRAILDSFDPDGHLEVSQHGYAHLPQHAGTVRKGEFLNVDSASAIAARTILARGFRRMRRAFGGRFRGGYSAPYDGLPQWLPAVWKEIGGSYISWMEDEPSPGAIDGVRMDLDPWDWQANAERPVAELVEHAASSIRERGYAGLVLHPGLVRETEHKRMLERFVGAFLEGGCSPAYPSALGTGKPAGAAES